MNKILATFISATLPVTELRGSIPVAITVWDIDPLTAFFVSVLGNLVPMFAILYFLDPIQRFLSSRSKLAERFFQWLFARTRDKFGPQYHKYGAIGLAIFVGVPLPMTGVWTGAIAAWVFGIKKLPAILSISAGAVIAGIIVTLATVGVIHVF